MTDVTYKINRFNLPAFLIVGVDSNGKNRLFAFGLLSSERIEDFVWVFSNFRDIMDGVEPKVIISDQCPKISSAIREVFQESKHLYCGWHIQ